MDRKKIVKIHEFRGIIYKNEKKAKENTASCFFYEKTLFPKANHSNHCVFMEGVKSIFSYFLGFLATIQETNFFLWKS